jgi:hypothetical protein
MEPAPISDLGYRQSTAPIPLPAGDYSFQVALAGGTPDEAAIEAGPLSLDAGIAYTAAAVGDLEDGNLEILALVDDWSDIPEGSLRLQVVHAAPAVGEVDIWNVAGDDSAELLPNVPYKASGALDLPPDAYVIGIDADDDGAPDLTFDVDLSEVPAGAFLNVFANNDMEGGVALVAQLGDGTILTIPANE